MSQDRALFGMRILVVEDDYYLATDERQMLQSAGADVVGPFGNAEEACRAVVSEELDCALVDINLGSGPCFAVARELRDRGIPFLFTTGYEATVIPDEFQDVERVEKPTSTRAIVVALSRMR
jgi:DNA-binding response OmpR family regulator